MSKECNRCLKTKDMIEFRVNLKAKDGYTHACEECLMAAPRNTPSLRKAINAKCKECIYDPPPYGEGTCIEQIRQCLSPECPLFDVRPMIKM